MKYERHFRAAVHSETLKTIIGFSGQPEYHPARPGEIFSISLECDKAAMTLGWTPSIELQEGLEKTVEFFKRRIGRTG